MTYNVSRTRLLLSFKSYPLVPFNGLDTYKACPMSVFLRQFEQYIKTVKHLITNIRDQYHCNTFVAPIHAGSTNTFKLNHTNLIDKLTFYKQCLPWPYAPWYSRLHMWLTQTSKTRNVIDEELKLTSEDKGMGMASVTNTLPHRMVVHVISRYLLPHRQCLPLVGHSQCPSQMLNKLLSPRHTVILMSDLLLNISTHNHVVEFLVTATAAIPILATLEVWEWTE